MQRINNISQLSQLKQPEQSNQTKKINQINLIKWGKCLTASLIMAGSLLFAASVYGQVQGQLTGNHVRVREYPSLETNNNILFQVNRGQAVEVIDIAGDFYRVNVKDSRDVYIFRDYVGITETIGIPSQSGIPILAAPDSYYNILDIHNNGDNLIVTGRYGNWYQIRSGNDRGFVEGHLLNVSFGDSLPTVRPPRTGQTGGTFIDELIEYAKGYLGVPYRWGGTDARGFDCSGFVTTVMRRFDIGVHRTASGQAANNGFRIDRSELVPGDLVFFNTNGRSISHVGIYIGDNQFIHSAANGVVITGMNENYWRTRFVQANRLL